MDELIATHTTLNGERVTVNLDAVLEALAATVVSHDTLNELIESLGKMAREHPGLSIRSSAITQLTQHELHSSLVQFQSNIEEEIDRELGWPEDSNFDEWRRRSSGAVTPLDAEIYIWIVLGAIIGLGSMAYASFKAMKLSALHYTAPVFKRGVPKRAALRALRQKIRAMKVSLVRFAPVKALFKTKAELTVYDIILSPLFDNPLVDFIVDVSIDAVLPEPGDGKSGGEAGTIPEHVKPPPTSRQNLFSQLYRDTDTHPATLYVRQLDERSVKLRVRSTSDSLTDLTVLTLLQSPGASTRITITQT